METVACNLCGSNHHRIIYSMPDTRYFTSEWFNVVECLDCGLGFVNPRPTSPGISKYYPSKFYDYFEQERDFHLHRYAAEAKFLPRIGPEENKRLLDLGCANGDFPRFMLQLGWRVEGVEVSQQSKSIRDFKVYKQEFNEIEVHEPRYDAITAWAVLEHVHDPMAHFKKVGQLLKSGGVFVFLVTNFESLSSRCLFLEDVPRHLYFFTEKTIRRYLQESDLKLMKANYSSKIYSMHPINFLRYYYYHYFKKRKMEWSDIQMKQFYADKNKKLQNSMERKLNHLISDPLGIVDQLLMPIYERYQVVTKRYGIVTYVARKS